MSLRARCFADRTCRACARASSRVDHSVTLLSAIFRLPGPGLRPDYTSRLRREILTPRISAINPGIEGGNIKAIFFLTAFISRFMSGAWKGGVFRSLNLAICGLISPLRGFILVCNIGGLLLPYAVIPEVDKTLVAILLGSAENDLSRVVYGSTPSTPVIIAARGCGKTISRWLESRWADANNSDSRNRWALTERRRSPRWAPSFPLIDRRIKPDSPRPERLPRFQPPLASQRLW